MQHGVPIPAHLQIQRTRHGGLLHPVESRPHLHLPLQLCRLDGQAVAHRLPLGQALPGKQSSCLRAREHRSADKKLRRFHAEGCASPMVQAAMSFSLGSPAGDVAWSPYSATVFAAVTEDGLVRVFDLHQNTTEPLCEQRAVAKTGLTRLAFNPRFPVLLVGDDRRASSALSEIRDKPHRSARFRGQELQGPRGGAETVAQPAEAQQSGNTGRPDRCGIGQTGGRLACGTQDSRCCCQSCCAPRLVTQILAVYCQNAQTGCALQHSIDLLWCTSMFRLNLSSCHSFIQAGLNELMCKP